MVPVLFLLLAPIASRADQNIDQATNLTMAMVSTNGNSVRKLGPSDQIKIVVYQEDDLGVTVTLDEKGMVMLPLLGKVKLGDMSVESATEYLAAAYNKDYLVNPQVNITVLQYAERHFSVLGEVQRPGSFVIPDNQTVNILEAIAQAGGYTRLGSPEKVAVRRVIEGQTVIYNLNADAIARKKDGKAFEILPEDVVIVGERTF